jgi:hypothetical protein
VLKKIKELIRIRNQAHNLTILKVVFLLSWRQLNLLLYSCLHGPTHVLYQLVLEITQSQIQGLSYLLPLNFILHRLLLMDHGCSIYIVSDYWSKCLVIVFSLLLGESSGQKLGFVHLYIVICNMLDLLDQS